MTSPVRDDAQRRAAVGSSWPRLDSREKVLGCHALRGRRPRARSRPAPRAPRPEPLRARDDRPRSTRRRPSQVPGVVAVLTRGRPADQGLRGHADVRAAREGARRSSPASRWPSSSPRPRRRPRTASSAVMVDYTPIEPTVDMRAGDGRRAPRLARPHKHNAAEDGRPMASPHAAVGHADEASHRIAPRRRSAVARTSPSITEELSSERHRQALAPARRRRRGARGLGGRA